MKHFFCIACFLSAACFSFAQAPSGWKTLPNSPSQGRFDDISFINADTGWAAGSGGEIYYTTDAGVSWTKQFDSTVYFRSIKFIDSKTGFAGTLDSILYQTTNGGATWVDISARLPEPVVGICGLFIPRPNVIYAMGWYDTPGYLFKSTDSGTTWTKSNLNGLADALIDAYFFSADTGFITGSSGTHAVILYTDDGGQSWETKFKVSKGFLDQVWKIDFLDRETGYATFQTAGDSSFILRTHDKGMSWQMHNIGTSVSFLQGVGFINDSLGWTGGHFPGMYQTKDGGKTWEYYSFGFGFNRFQRINDTLIYASGQNIYEFNKNLLVSVPYTPEISAPVHRIISLYPNPASGTANLKFELASPTMANIGIYDLEGRLIRTVRNTYASAGEHQVPIPLKDLPPGNYMLIIKTFSQYLTQKLAILPGS